MRVVIGKYADKPSTTQLIVLKEPDYVAWVFDQTKPSGPLLAIKAAMARHIAVFDAKPFMTKCFHCGSPATRASAYRCNTNLMWWCNGCDPYSQGALEGRLTELRTYEQVLEHVRYTCGSSRGQFRQAIKNFAKGKGLPARLTEVGAVSYLT
jgi:hypothetical protein